MAILAAGEAVGHHVAPPTAADDRQDDFSLAGAPARNADWKELSIPPANTRPYLPQKSRPTIDAHGQSSFEKSSSQLGRAAKCLRAPPDRSGLRRDERETFYNRTSPAAAIDAGRAESTEVEAHVRLFGGPDR